MKCPFCAEEIQAEAIKCKHCGEWLVESKRQTTQKPTYEINKAIMARAVEKGVMRASANESLGRYLGRFTFFAAFVIGISIGTTTTPILGFAAGIGIIALGIFLIVQIAKH